MQSHDMKSKQMQIQNDIYTSGYKQQAVPSIINVLPWSQMYKIILRPQVSGCFLENWTPSSYNHHIGLGEKYVLLDVSMESILPTWLLSL